MNKYTEIYLSYSGKYAAAMIICAILQYYTYVKKINKHVK